MNSTDFLYGLIVVLYVTLILVVGGLFLSRSKRKKAREEAVAAAASKAYICELASLHRYYLLLHFIAIQ